MHILERQGRSWHNKSQRRTTNFVLRTKWLWRYHHEPGSMWKRTIDAKYNKRFKGDILVDDRYIIQGKQ